MYNRIGKHNIHAYNNSNNQPPPMGSRDNDPRVTFVVVVVATQGT